MFVNRRYDLQTKHLNNLSKEPFFIELSEYYVIVVITSSNVTK